MRVCVCVVRARVRLQFGRWLSALQAGDRPFLEVLHELGADVNAEIKGGCTPYDVAFASDSYGCRVFLRSIGRTEVGSTMTPVPPEEEIVGMLALCGFATVLCWSWLVLIGAGGHAGAHPRPTEDPDKAAFFPGMDAVVDRYGRAAVERHLLVRMQCVVIRKADAQDPAHQGKTRPIYCSRARLEEQQSKGQS